MINISLCVLTEERHDGSAGVVRVLPGDEGRHHEAQQCREDSHHGQRRDGRQEHRQLAEIVYSQEERKITTIDN